MPPTAGPTAEGTSDRASPVGEVLELAMENSAADLERLLDEVEAHLETRQVSARQQYGMRLALDELLSNVVKYAYDDEARHSVGVKIEFGGPMALEISDDGRPFNPVNDAPPPVLEGPVEDRPIGGLGLHMLRSLGMQMAYRREGNRNLLRVVFPEA